MYDPILNADLDSAGLVQAVIIFAGTEFPFNVTFRQGTSFHSNFVGVGGEHHSLHLQVIALEIQSEGFSGIFPDVEQGAAAQDPIGKIHLPSRGFYKSTIAFKVGLEVGKRPPRGFTSGDFERAGSSAAGKEPYHRVRMDPFTPSDVADMSDRRSKIRCVQKGEIQDNVQLGVVNVHDGGRAGP